MNIFDIVVDEICDRVNVNKDLGNKVESFTGVTTVFNRFMVTYEYWINPSFLTSIRMNIVDKEQEKNIGHCYVMTGSTRVRLAKNDIKFASSKMEYDELVVLSNDRIEEEFFMKSTVCNLSMYSIEGIMKLMQLGEMG